MRLSMKYVLLLSLTALHLPLLAWADTTAFIPQDEIDNFEELYANTPIKLTPNSVTLVLDDRTAKLELIERNDVRTEPPTFHISTDGYLLKIRTLNEKEPIGLEVFERNGTNEELPQIHPDRITTDYKTPEHFGFKQTNNKSLSFNPHGIVFLSGSGQAIMDQHLFINYFKVGDLGFLFVLEKLEEESNIFALQEIHMPYAKITFNEYDELSASIEYDEHRYDPAEPFYYRRALQKFNNFFTVEPATPAD